MSSPELNLRRIEAFLAVMELGNISRAAAQIEVAQSVVSRHLAALEAQLGCRLFERTGRGVAPTPSAARLAPRLRAAMDEMLRATNEAAETGNQPGGIVRLGVVPSAAQPLVGRLYQRVAERLPRVQLQFVEGFSNSLEEQIADARIDLAVINRFGRLVRRGEERLCVLESLVIGPAGMFAPGQTLSFRQLAERPLVLATRPNGRAPFDQASRHTGVQLRVVAEADSLLIMKALVLDAGLCTVLPRQALHDELDRGLMSAARLVRPTIPRVLSLVSSARNPGSEAARAVARELRELVDDSLRDGAW
jgi:DNA-binding transcriptional LysR family regulator